MKRPTQSSNRRTRDSCKFRDQTTESLQPISVPGYPFLESPYIDLARSPLGGSLQDQQKKSDMNSHYDVLIVGAGIAGSALAHALSTITSKLRPSPLRVALLERSLAEPDRIVGELLQPAGVAALQKLGLRSCLDGIDAIPEHGYCVIHSGQIVHIPYPDGNQGRSFHHGRFIMALRDRAKQAAGVDVIEATVNELIECQLSKRVLGVRATRPSSEGSSKGAKESFFADLVVIADGCFSNFRSAVMGKATRESSTRSHFCGAILKDTRLPIPQHGTVALVQGHGPVLLYQISEHDTRMLVDVKAPVPQDLKVRTASVVQFIWDSSPLLTTQGTHSQQRRAATSRVPPPRRPRSTRQRSHQAYA